MSKPFGPARETRHDWEARLARTYGASSFCLVCGASSDGKCRSCEGHSASEDAAELEQGAKRPPFSRLYRGVVEDSEAGYPTAPRTEALRDVDVAGEGALAIVQTRRVAGRPVWRAYIQRWHGARWLFYRGIATYIEPSHELTVGSSMPDGPPTETTAPDVELYVVVGRDKEPWALVHVDKATMDILVSTKWHPIWHPDVTDVTKCIFLPDFDDAGYRITEEQFLAVAKSLGSPPVPPSLATHSDPEPKPKSAPNAHRDTAPDNPSETTIDAHATRTTDQPIAANRADSETAAGPSPPPQPETLAAPPALKPKKINGYHVDPKTGKPVNELTLKELADWVGQAIVNANNDPSDD